MPNKLAAYYSLVLVAAAAVLAAADWAWIYSLGANHWVGLAAFAGLATLSEHLATQSPKNVRSSVAFLPLLAVAIVFPPPAVAMAVVVVHVIVDARQSQLDRVSLFNIAAGVLAYGTAGLIFHHFAGTGTVDNPPTDVLGLFFPFYASILPYFGINLLTVSGYIAIRGGHPLKQVITEATGRGGGNLLFDFLASPLAALIAYLYWRAGIPGLVSVVLLLLLVRHSYLNAFNLERTNRDLLRVLIKAIETRDPYTSGHSLRVSKLARTIAEDLGLRGKRLANVENVGLLHDIGKIEALYVEIISKEGSLTAEERDVIQTHATKGAELLETLTSVEQGVVDGVRHHHERYDGTGYPHGLEGKDIPLPARIIMICDAVDAMLSDRPYRKALSLSHVREELVRCSGTQFDPDIVRTILSSNTLERAELLVDRSGARSPLRAVVG